LVNQNRSNLFSKKQKKIIKIINQLNSVLITPNEAAKYSIKITKDGVKRSAFQLLGLKGVDMKKIRSLWPKITQNEQSIDNQIENQAHYQGYLPRQFQDIAAFKKDENIMIPVNINYDLFSGLSNEVKSKLKSIKPKTLGQAIRIDGITPAAVILILGYIKRLKYKATA
jgi:tRNA uridine 5-carboxymethylaminomethyl modification enzyme